MSSTQDSTILKTRFLEKNTVAGSDKIRFQDEGHLYWAYSEFYDDWVSTKSGVGACPLESTTTILGKYFVTDMDKVALDLWNNPKLRLLMETEPTYKYYGCKCIDDIRAIWSKGATEGTRMHENFEDFVNLIEYDKANPPSGCDANTFAINPIIGISKAAATKTAHKEDVLLHAVSSTRSYDESTNYDNVNVIKNYKFHIRNDTASYLYAQAKLEGYNEKMYLFMFLEKFKLLDPLSGVNFYRTELMMWHNVLHISGMIDALLYDKNTNTYIIVDWKRCKNGVKGDPDPNNKRTKPVHLLSAGGRGQGLPAFENLRNHNGNKYGCQLTLYKHMFEHMTGEKISGMFLIVVDSTKIGKANALDIQEVPLTKYDECIRQVFENRAREILANYEETLDDDHMNELIKFLPEDDDPGSPVSTKRSPDWDGELVTKKVKT